MKLSYILKDARKNREENRLYYYSLILVFIVSYTVLSFDKTTISSFLYTENIFSIKDYLTQNYILSIIFLLTLIFFATRNQIENRKEEFGILMMLGEKRSNIAKKLSIEAIINSLYALVIAFPIALFLNDFINLFAIKVLELGLKSHSLKISFNAIIISILVVIFLQIISIRLITFFTLKKEVYKLILGKRKDDSIKEKKISEKNSLYLSLIIFFIDVMSVLVFGRIVSITIFLFFLSLYFFYRGFSYILDKLSKKSISRLFEIRLIDEKFKYEYKSLFITNVIMVVSFVLLSLPMTQSFSLKDNFSISADFTIYDKKESVDRMYSQDKYKNILEKPQPFYMTNIREEIGQDNYVVTNPNYGTYSYVLDYLIKESSMNLVLEKQGQDPIELKDNEAMVMDNVDRNFEYYDEMHIEEGGGSYAEVGGQTFSLIPKIVSNNIFSNKVVFDQPGLVVSDNVYDNIVKEKEPYAYNLYIKPSYKNEEGTIRASDNIRDMMIEDQLKYESNIWEIKNDISWFLIELYTNLYLGFLLFIIANTYIAFKFIYWVKENKERFKIKRLLGADVSDTRKKMERIINFYFIFLYLISFLANLVYYKFNILNLADETISNRFFIYINIGLIVFEIFYIGVIKKITRDEVEKSR